MDILKKYPNPLKENTPCTLIETRGMTCSLEIQLFLHNCSFLYFFIEVEEVEVFICIPLLLFCYSSQYIAAEEQLQLGVLLKDLM